MKDCDVKDCENWELQIGTGHAWGFKHRKQQHTATRTSTGTYLDAAL